ncbi:nitrilase-related carbon-nitrogen hydrolase [Klebsiella pneumoniae]|uniref:nitrilase-related carbon-nitrogen hydrolase n=1 Tax=Klebsiella pneumoniae TaxID=573 RepID=UPI0018A324A9|nr:nitrilase-related carbon-nitrogen hydrolase [Klebsiella pneumoniae]
MRVAAGQFAVTPVWRTNAQTCVAMMQQAEREGAALLAARALDTTCYIVAAGECGTRNIGLSRIVDPLGTTLAGAGSEPQLIFADLSADDLARVRERLPVLRNRRFAPPQLL